MPRVLNKYKDQPLPSDSVYIGRPSKWGNPFAIDDKFARDRRSVIEDYSKWIQTKPELIAAAKSELKGRDLVCFCAPRACHGDILLEIANEGENG